MNDSEALMRIAKVARWGGYVNGALLAAVGIYVAETSDSTAILLLIPAGGIAGVGWVLAWIIEGFAKGATNG